MIGALIKKLKFNENKNNDTTASKKSGTDFFGRI